MLEPSAQNSLTAEARLARTALVVAGHGSTENPDSSTPTRAHAEELRRRGIFAEVVSCFWKEAPHFREILSMVASDQVIVVPNFISEGYFTQTVIPRELDLDGPITHRGSRTIHYSQPVGNHPAMTQALLRAARGSGLDPALTSLLIVGHGTGKNKTSALAAKIQATRIRKLGIFAQVEAAYMEEPPLISDWHSLSSQQNVVVVPYFISDGLHSYQNIPVLLGIQDAIGPAASQAEVFKTNPHPLRGKTLHYAAAIGTDPTFADIILDQAMQCIGLPRMRTGDDDWISKCER